MEQTLSSWVLNHYRQHFTHDLMKDVFAMIPQANFLSPCQSPQPLLSFIANGKEGSTS